MNEKSNIPWKIATIVCATLLMGAVVAVVVLALNTGDQEANKASQDEVQALEDEVGELKLKIGMLEADLAQAQADLQAAQASNSSSSSSSSSSGQSSSKTSDRQQLAALGEQMCNENFHVGEIVIDGGWARVSIAPNDPSMYQGEPCYYHKINGQWTLIDSGTGLQYGDIPGAPASIFP